MKINMLNNDILNKITTKIDSELSRINDNIPYISQNGSYSTDMRKKDITWWTNGFWSGILWQLYNATNIEHYKNIAQKNELDLDKAFLEFKGLHHDVGFMWLHTAVADYRLTKNEKSKQRGLHAAELLAGRYNPHGKFIRSWNKDNAGWVIIDSMMNIQILFWASEVLSDPRFNYIAEDHADTVMKNIIRPDGSVGHIGVFDPVSGNFLNTLGGQGYNAESAWARGQAWAIYGFALSYRHTHRKAYLDTAKRVANFFIANISQTENIPLVDFRSPLEPRKIDVSAGVCAACGLLEISNFVPSFEKKWYKKIALNILEAVIKKHINLDPLYDGIVLDSTTAYHDTKGGLQQPIIYADYFFIEAILRIQKKDFLIW